MNIMLLALLKIVMPIIAWLLAKILSGKDSGNICREVDNKLEVMELVTKNDSILPKTESWPPLENLVEKGYQQGEFPALWAIEGLGYHYANQAISRDVNLRGLLHAQYQPKLQIKSLTMLHAGIGLSFSQIGFRQTDLTRTTDLRIMVENFLRRCHENSRQGYLCCAVESLGLVARFEHGQSMVKKLDAILSDKASEYIPYLWHGSGRATYFSPQNFIPRINLQMRAVTLCHEEATHEIGRLNMLAGLGWAITMVNMRHPEVMHSFLKIHSADQDTLETLANGMISAIMMREDITPGFSQCFLDTEPQSSENEMRSRWERYIRRPGKNAIEVIYPTLSMQNQLEKVFRYQDYEMMLAT